VSAINNINPLKNSPQCRQDDEEHEAEHTARNRDAKGESEQHKRDRGTEPLPFARVFEQLEPRI
jgi:hypothetical protein